MVERSGGKQPYLKAKNIWWLRLFITINIAVFLSVIINRQLTSASIEHFSQRIFAKDGLIALCFPLVTIILNGVIGDAGKARLVFWRWTNPLPGCRAFTKIIEEDPRIDVNRLREKINPLPTEPKEQNSVWYRLYKRHADKQTVLEAHQSYLLTRDMTALSAVLAISFSVGSFLSAIGWKTATLYSGTLLIQYLIVSTSARNYGNRFVANVLTEESHA